jgi:hypothetical protein
MIDVDRLAMAFRESAERLLSEWTQDISISCDPDPPRGRFFVAEAIARAPAAEIRMTFGDREFEIRTSVKPEGRPWPLQLAFYLRAMDVDESGVLDGMWVHDEDRMRRVMARQADALRLCLKRIEEDARGWWSLAEGERQTAIEKAKEQLRETEMNVAVKRAGEAFRAGDFAQVVALLSRFTDILSDAQMQKLKLARDRVGSKPD